MPNLPDQASSASLFACLTLLGFSVALLAIAIGVRTFIGSLDRERIDECIQQRRGTLVNIVRIHKPIDWLFAKGRFRRYEVTYLAGNGEIRTANCVTSFWMGVYWAD